MEQLHNGFQLHICPGGFPLSTDSMALAGFVRLHKGDSVLDLGSGCGTLGLLLCADHDSCCVTGIELDSAAHAAALDNIRRNGLSDRLNSICGDIADPAFVTPGSFQVCVSNPPYFTAGPTHSELPNARQELNCTMASLFSAAARALKFGGSFFLVHRPERLAELFACSVQNGLEPKRLQLLRHHPNAPVNLVLVQCKKGAKPGLIWEEACLQDENGAPSDYYRKLYHL